MTAESTAKKTTQKLQRAIVDSLEDVKAQDIQVFDTTALSPLFERVIVATGSSNRQTKALAASVRDGVREAGFAKPRIEGEDNGEWIIVDCGQAVVHVMQPQIRRYYNLEEIWGDKPVRLRLGAPKPVVKLVAPASKTSAKRKAASTSRGAVQADAPTPKSKRAQSTTAKTSAKPIAKAAPKATIKAAPKVASKAPRPKIDRS